MSPTELTSWEDEVADTMKWLTQVTTAKTKSTDVDVHFINDLGKLKTEFDRLVSMIAKRKPN